MFLFLSLKIKKSASDVQLVFDRAEIHIRLGLMAYLLTEPSFHCRLTLLLGPPGCGKTTLLLALAGKLKKSLKVILQPIFVKVLTKFRDFSRDMHKYG